MRHIFSVIFAFVVLSASAQKVRISVEAEGMENVVFCVATPNDENINLLLTNGYYQAIIERKNDVTTDVRRLYWSGESADGGAFQMYVPICLRADMRNIHFKVCHKADGSWDVQTSDNDNQTLITYSLEVGVEMLNMHKTEGLVPRLQRYYSIADSLGKSVSPELRQYMALSSRLTAQATADMVISLQRGKEWQMPEEAKLLLGSPEKYLDCDMALLFEQAPQVVLRNLDGRTSIERMKYLFAHYKNDRMRREVGRKIASSFVTHYNYSNGYEQGRAILDSLLTYIGIDEQFVRLYEMRCYSAVGAEMPDDDLVDADGNIHHLSELKGKYVYIDLWASWCVPCIKEIPHLKELEKRTLAERNDIVFVSLSIDTDEEAWKQAMLKHDVHGIQWRVKGTALADKLNISGIPHFVIYNKDGHLYNPAAKRPSQINNFDF